MDKFKNTYRVQSHRMPHWDYSANGMYFITLVTQNRECHLGKIANGKMDLSDWGAIVNDEWLKSFEIRQELYLDEYIIMPNHLHAIVVLNQPDTGRVVGIVETHGRASLQSPPQRQQQPPPQQQSQSPSPDFIRKPKSISSFIAGFKSAVNTKIDDYIDEHQWDIPKYNRDNHFFQPNYHDHIIRNDVEYRRIKQYIINNPSNWQDDALNKR